MTEHDLIFGKTKRHKIYRLALKFYQESLLGDQPIEGMCSAVGCAIRDVFGRHHQRLMYFDLDQFPELKKQKPWWKTHDQYKFWWKKTAHSKRIKALERAIELSK